MKIHQLFHKKLKDIGKIVLFLSLLIISVLPLTLLNNKLLQFLGAAILLVLGLYLNSKFIDKREFSDYGVLFKRQTTLHILVGCVIGFCAVWFMLIFGSSTKVLSISPLGKSIQIAALFPFFARMFLVAVIEETFFRGYLFTTFKDVFSTETWPKKNAIYFALVASSILFGLAHFSNNNASLLSITLLTINGMVWCIPFIISKNLGLSIGMHASWNFFQTQLGFTMSGNNANKSFYDIQNIGSELITGGSYGPEAGVLGLLGFGFMLTLSLLYLHYEKNNLKTIYK